jgi:hypothetical protein
MNERGVSQTEQEQTGETTGLVERMDLPCTTVACLEVAARLALENAKALGWC